jgi:phage head maturation protease
MRLRFTAPAVTATADTDRLTITGVVVPFDVAALPSSGGRVSFAADGRHTPTATVELNREHNADDVIGVAGADDFVINGDAIRATFRVIPSTRGRDTLAEVAAGVRTGLSVEADVLNSDVVDGVTRITASSIVGVAVVRRPAFDAARIEAGEADHGEADHGEADQVEADHGEADHGEADHGEAGDTVAASNAPTAADRPRDTTKLGRVVMRPTVGEYVCASLSNDPQRLAGVVDRIVATGGDVSTFLTDIPGLIPVPLLSDILRLYDASSPLFNALGSKAAPAARSFRVPMVTSRLDVAETAPEGVDMTADFVIGEVDVAMTPLKRAVVLSAEAILYSQIDVVGEAVGQLADSLITGREKYAVDALAATTGKATPVAVKADGSDVWAKLAAAAADTIRTLGRAPSLVAVDLTTWAALAGMTNVVGAPLVSGVQQTLSGVAGSMFGLPVVASPLLAKSYLIAGGAVATWLNGDVRMRAESAPNLTYSMGGLMSVGVAVANGAAIRELSIA